MGTAGLGCGGTGLLLARPPCPEGPAGEPQGGLSRGERFADATPSPWHRSGPRGEPVTSIGAALGAAERDPLPPKVRNNREGYGTGR